VLPAILDDAGGVLAYGRKRRLASPGLRKAVIARDRGCTFPGCPRTAAQSEIHHATDWANGGPTDLNNLAIACGYHNTEGPKQGWQTIMLDGIPHWQPPDWHPHKQPMRNYLHHPELLTPPPE
jgi:HNH endonuclease